MADLSYDVQVNTTAAERNLANLQKTVGGLNDVFVRFRSTLATISLGAVITQSLQYADAISDLSDASGIAIGNILGFNAAVMANGGSAEGAQKAILKLVNSIGDAAAGSEETQKQFNAVGVSLNDLRTLSEQEILQKTIEGLDKITDNGKRSIAVTALLGKEFRNVAAGGLAKAYADATAESAKYSDAIKAGAAAQQNIDKTLTDFKTGLLAAFKPLNDLVASINIGVDNFQRFIQAVMAVAAALLTWTYAGRIIAALRVTFVLLKDAALGIFVAFKDLGAFFAQLIRGFGALWRSTEGAGGAFARFLLSIKAVGVAILEILAPAFTVLQPLMKPLFVGAAAAAGFFADKVAQGISSVKSLIETVSGGLIKFGGDPREGQRGRGDPQEIANREAEIAKAKELREVRDKAAEREMDRIRKFNAALTGQQQTYTQLNSEAQTFSNYLLSDLKFQTSLLGMSEDQKEIATALNAETQRYLQQQNSLQSKLSDVQSQIGIELKSQKTLKDDELAASKDKVSLLVEEEGRLQQLSKTYLNLHLTNGKNLESELKNQQRIKNAEAERLSNLEYISERLKEQAASYENLGGALRSINDKRVELKFETDTKKLSPLRQQIANINEEARKAALEAGRSLAATFESEDGLTPERAQQLADGLSAIASGYKNIADSQITALGVSKEYLAEFPAISNEALNSFASWREEFAVGTKDAFTKFKEDAMDAGKQAKDSFSTFTSGMEDAFVKFVQTGKLSFSDLANSIIADLARIAIRKAIVGMASLFGFAAGGPVMGGTPIIVGERGPELFVPQSAGKIVPNNQLGGSGAGSSGAMQTTINYSIQAVDAASFRSLVARDPSFIYAVTEQGRRSQPTRSR